MYISAYTEISNDLSFVTPFIPFYIIQCVRGPNPISVWRLLSEDATESSSLSRQGSFWPQQHVIQAVCGSNVKVQYMWGRVKALLSHNRKTQKYIDRDK